jgi:V-type H+-transporting ATPase subunit a
MFGDFGHGMLMTMFASFLIYKEQALMGKPLNEMIKTCFDGRYVLLPMGLFSMYVGLLYNECFSIPIDLCTTNWSYPCINL